MKITLAFDGYGTLVEPAGMANYLADDLGDQAANFADFWREKQLEYSFRRGLMQNYADFSVCTSDALNFTCQTLQGAHLPRTTKRVTTSIQAFAAIRRCHTGALLPTHRIPSLRLFQW